jgi:glycosyltransferase involved in cell wall biosynthesis
MARTLALDLTCLFLAPLSRTPRGIDRVELAYAHHFLQHWEGDCVAVLPTPWGVRFFDRARAIRGVQVVQELWRESINVQDDEVFIAAKKALIAPASREAVFSGLNDPLSLSTKIKGFYEIIRGSGFSFGHSCQWSLPRNAVYLNVGQLTILRAFFWWLKHRPDVSAVFMVHDAIPIEYPDLHVRVGVKLHNSILRNIAEFASALILPSCAARDSVLGHLASLKCHEKKSHVELLPVPSPFLEDVGPDPDLIGKEYFITCGVIDAHKNHLTLLRAWEILVRRHGKGAPRLLIAGLPGVTSAVALEYLQRSESLHSHVMVASGLSTPALRQMMRDSRGLLMPSVAEGFGLPIVEGLAQKVPVIASDIPAHREAGAGGEVIYVDALNAEKWAEAVDRVRAKRNEEPGAYIPKTWEQYFLGIERFIHPLP